MGDAIFISQSLGAFTNLKASLFGQCSLSLAFMSTVTGVDLNACLLGWMVMPGFPCALLWRKCWPSIAPSQPQLLFSNPIIPKTSFLASYFLAESAPWAGSLSSCSAWSAKGPGQIAGVCYSLQSLTCGATDSVGFGWSWKVCLSCLFLQVSATLRRPLIAPSQNSELDYVNPISSFPKDWQKNQPWQLVFEVCMHSSFSWDCLPSHHKFICFTLILWANRS